MADGRHSPASCASIRHQPSVAFGLEAAMILRLAPILFLVAAARAWTQSPVIPDTPAGHTLHAWLDAFNSGDRARIQAYVATYDLTQSADGTVAFRERSGGCRSVGGAAHGSPSASQPRQAPACEFLPSGIAQGFWRARPGRGYAHANPDGARQLPISEGGAAVLEYRLLEVQRFPPSRYLRSNGHCSDEFPWQRGCHHLRSARQRRGRSEDGCPDLDISVRQAYPSERHL